MGMFSGGAGAATAAGQVQHRGLVDAAGGLEEQFNITQSMLQPFINAGMPALQQQVGGSTAGGFASNIRDLLSGGSLDPLVESRSNTIRDILSSQGLTRSGEGLQELAAVPTETAFGIEQMLNQRQGNLANAGRNTALGSGQLRGANAGNIANLMTGASEATASGILGAEQATAQEQQNMLSLFTSLFGGGGF